MRGIKPKICPKCGSGEIVPIVYGYPLESLMEEAKQGKVELGGCCVSDNDPDFKCKSCGSEFRK